MARGRLLAENRKQTLDEFLHSHKQEGKLKDYYAWMKENHPDVEPVKWAYYYARRSQLYPQSKKKGETKKVVKVPLPKKASKPKKQPKKVKKSRSRPQAGQLIDLTELRANLQKQGVSVEEHKLLLETWTKMRMLNPALSRMAVEEGPNGEPIWEIRRVQIASGVG